LRDDATVVERGSEAVLTGIRSAREQRQRDRHADAMGRVYEGQSSGGAWREWRGLLAFHAIHIGISALPVLALMIRRRRERKRKEREEREREEKKEGGREERKEGEREERRRHARDWNIT